MQNKSIKIDGSSTVYPITKAVVGAFKASREKPVDIDIDFSGTGGGFDKFCAGETEIRGKTSEAVTRGNKCLKPLPYMHPRIGIKQPSELVAFHQD
ncbi:hypothetical protein IQ238_21620 [Pleurocapsales cyanobacterium LEGE 06147]|nr:hypothetical protein [Pleurocapsales cyanobacterium LEGE 06147]